MQAILIENLKKSYPVVKRYRELIFHPFRRNVSGALLGVDLEVRTGECFCLLGPNGAGKTTLIKIMSTLIWPDHGRVLVNGYDVTRESSQIKSSIGFAINEERSFYWRLTGRQNLDFFASLNNLRSSRRKERIQKVLRITGLEDVADNRFNTYSTGMRQMMAFARALLAEPKTLFVDEPTRSLDPRAAEKVRRFIRREIVDKQKSTVFWATHNLNEALEYAHRIAIIDKGKIKALGTPDQLTKEGTISLFEAFEKAVGEEAGKR